MNHNFTESVFKKFQSFKRASFVLLDYGLMLDLVHTHTHTHNVTRIRGNDVKQ